MNRRDLVLGVVFFLCGVVGMVAVTAGWRILSYEELQCIALPGPASSERVHVKDDRGSGCSKGELCLFHEVGVFEDAVRVTDCGPER